MVVCALSLWCLASVSFSSASPASTRLHKCICSFLPHIPFHLLLRMTVSDVFLFLFCFGLLQVLLLALHSMITLGGSQGITRVVKDWTSIGCVQDKHPTCCTFSPAYIFLKKFFLCFKLAKCFRTCERPMLNGSSYPGALTTCWLSGRLLPQSFLPGINTCSLHHHCAKEE